MEQGRYHNDHIKPIFRMKTNSAMKVAAEDVQQQLKREEESTQLSIEKNFFPVSSRFQPTLGPIMSMMKPNRMTKHTEHWKMSE